MMFGRHWLVLAALLALPEVGFANAPSTSVLSTLRPGTQTQVADRRIGVFAVIASALPKARPRGSAAAAPATTVAVAPNAPRVELPSASGNAVLASARPKKRPRSVLRRAARAAKLRPQPAAVVVGTKRGSVCGDRSIRGQAISPIAGRLRGCGVSNPVRVTAVDGVTLTSPATINCTAAKALKKWVTQSVKSTVGRSGGGVKSLKVVAHYACRTRNNRSGAKISEHGKGNAIDIAAINLVDGTSITVLHGWRNRSQSKILKRVHRDACGTFGTVLGPNADRYHQDHFHFDVARHRGGAYCR